MDNALFIDGYKKSKNQPKNSTSPPLARKRYFTDTTDIKPAPEEATFTACLQAVLTVVTPIGHNR